MKNKFYDRTRNIQSENDRIMRNLRHIHTRSSVHSFNNTKNPEKKPDSQIHFELQAKQINSRKKKHYKT